MTNALWYFGRGFGVSALVLFSIVVVLGVVTRAGRPLPGLPRFAVATLHRTASLAAVLFLGLHVLTLLLDPYAQLHLTDVVLPFLARYRPLWQGLGTLAFDLALVLVVSSLLRHRLGLRTWRAVHWAAYACWPLAVGHAVGIGTDRHTSWLLGVVAGCVLLVAGAVAWRVWGTRFAAPAPPRRVAPPSDLAGLR
ncbi:MAG TPA: ferric reductase-like transmembrane domain-containing protein [Marmoricola sp.]